ncbi:MAG: 3'-5' exonuclease [Bacteroidales bacterium]|nr:3'-5' exonuclease [Bacteroidales bacterium]
MQNFNAIDFETANSYRSSVCSVGVVIVRNGKIVKQIYELIQPEPNYYNYHNIMVHGLTQDDTDQSPVFPKVWKKIEPYLENYPLVAHNKPFDESCLKACFKTYGMTYPDYEFYCTLSASRKKLKDKLPNCQLQTVSAYFGYDLTQHHHALADAEACAIIAIKLLD